MSVQSEITRLEAAKAAISQAITEKGVTVPNGTMLDAMAPLISAIEAGGGGGGGSPSVSATSKDVNFIDYDGTLLYSYTAAEAQALTELPPLPSHDGLICQGWNYDLETIKDYNRDVTVGAMYITDDGKTRIYIHLEDARTAPMLGCCPKGTVTVDWGDGSTPETLTGTSVSTAVWTNNHQYASAGDYVITLTVDGTMGFYGESSSNTYSGILRFSSSKDARNIVYQSSIAKVEIGNGITSIGNYAFYNCHSLTSISIPDGVTSIGQYAFHSCHNLASVSIPDGVISLGSNAFQTCYSLASVSIPDGVENIGMYAFHNCYSLASISIPGGVDGIAPYVFQNCYSLTRVSISDGTKTIGNYAFQNCNSLTSILIPDSVTSFGGYMFQYCRSLKSISIPDGEKTLGANLFQNCYSLTRFSIPDSVTSIKTYTFQNCYGVVYYDFTRHTTVPSLAHTNAFNGIPADCEIRVPAALVDEWKAATNWSTYEAQIVGV